MRETIATRALTARHVLLEDAVVRYRSGERSFSELAEETGLVVEEIMDAVAAAGGVDDRGAAVIFSASVRTAAERLGARALLSLAESALAEAVEARSSDVQPKR